MERVSTVVTFSVAESLFAVDVSLVREILAARQATKLPNAPDHLLGLIDVRGASVPLVDLRCILNESLRDDDEDTRIIMLAFEQAGRNHLVALRTDRVIEVSTLDDDGRISSVEEAEMLNWDPRIVLGIGRKEGAIVTLLNVNAIFDRKTMAALNGRASAPDASLCL